MMKSNLPIFLIDDDIDRITLLGTMLADEPYTLTTALTGNQALEILNTTTTIPAIIITDMVLPDVPGGYIIRHIRSQERFNNTRIVILTSYEHYVTPQDRQLVDAVLVKSIKKAELIKTLRELLDKKPDNPTLAQSYSDSKA